MLYYFFNSVMLTIYQAVVYEGLPAGIITVGGAFLTTFLVNFAVWVFCYVFMSIGLFVMAKRRNMRYAFLAFIPIASTYLLGKLVGEINFFGLKIKRIGLIAVIVEGVLLVLTILQDALYFPLLVDMRYDIFNEQSYMYFKDNMGKFFEIQHRILNISFVVLSFVSELVGFILLLYLFRNYAPRSGFIFALLSLFFEILGPIFVFVVRKNSCEEYREYMKMKMHSMYGGGNPYQYDDGNYRDPYDLSKQESKGEKPESPFGEYDDKK